MSSFKQKYRMSNNNGQDEIIWDISAMLKDLQNAKHPVCNRRLCDFYEANNPCGNIEYAMKTDLKEPCIVVELTDKTYKLIDGNHRLYKAKQLGVKNIPCYILPLEYHKIFIIDFDYDVYKRVASFYEKVMNDIA
jgi:hypothetical protein